MKESQGRASLLLLELIIDLFLFVICAAVCVGLLLHARSMSAESRDLTDAVYLAQSAAEMWRSGLPPQACNGDSDGLQVKASTPHGEDMLHVSVYKGDALVYALEGVSRDE